MKKRIHMTRIAIPPLVINADGTVRDDVSDEDKEFLQGWQPTTVGTAKDHAESDRVGRAIRAVIKQCWFNCRRAILKLDELANASYIEGWAILRGFPIEHAWIVHQDKIIDPTLPADEGLYFPGLEFQGRLGINEFLATAQGKECKKSPFLYAFGWGGMLSPSFHKCYEEAMGYLTMGSRNSA
jgi:hypothetical protein